MYVLSAKLVYNLVKKTFCAMNAGNQVLAFHGPTAMVSPRRSEGKQVATYNGSTVLDSGMESGRYKSFSPINDSFRSHSI